MTDELGSATTDAASESRDDDALDSFNPFARHLDVVSMTGMTIATAEALPSAPKPFEVVVQPRVDEQFVDWEFLEKLQTWGGALKEPRERTEEEFDSEITQALQDREEQFILRNLRRVERHADPDKPIRLDAEQARYGMGPGAVRAHIAELDDMERVTFIEELGCEALANRQRWMTWLRSGIQWQGFFAKELRKDHPGPVWKRSPNGPEDPRAGWPAGAAPEQDDDGAEDQGPEITE